MSSASSESFGALLARLRASRGISQLRLAELLCAASGLCTVTRHEVSRWEREERVPTVFWLRWLAVVLDRPVEELESAAIISRHRRSAGEFDRLLWTMPDHPPVRDLLDQDFGQLVRMAHSWLAQEPKTAGTGARAVDARRGLRVPDRLTDRLRELRRMDDLIGGADLGGLVGRELRTATAQSRSRPAVTYGPMTAGFLAELAQLAGWIAGDAGRTAAAARAYRIGLSAAMAAGDRALGAHLLGCLSHLTVSESPREALVLARAAHSGIRRTSCAGLQILLLHRIAMAAALAGERRAAEEALYTAERLVDRRVPDLEPDWLYWLDEGEMTALAGRCFAALGRPLRAEPLLRQRVRQPDRSRPRTLALDAGWLALAYLDAGEVEPAAASAGTALIAAIRSGSPRATARALAPRRRLAARPATGAARDYADLVAAAWPYLPRSSGRAGRSEARSGVERAGGGDGG